MSNLEEHPVSQECVADPRGGVEVITAREVPLGGPRAMRVRRTLPQRQRSLIGAWCFIDHYGPEDVSTSAGMDVAPHPHTGLQTVSWLVTGEIEHHDSAGVHAMVRPGELNLMSAGHGISHSEVSTPDTTILHGAQLWLALPDAVRDDDHGFDHFAPEPVTAGDAQMRVFLGDVGMRVGDERVRADSPVRTATALVGAEIVLPAHTTVTLEVAPTHEHGVLSDRGDIAVENESLAVGELGFVGVGSPTVVVANRSDTSGRVLLVGGEPFTEEIIMWWNFVGRTHDEIASYRAQWEAGDVRFGTVEGYRGPHPRIPAPEMPTTTLRPRANPAPHAGSTRGR